MEVSLVGHTVRVEVADGNAEVPVLGAGPIDRLSGWGLPLVDALASGWRVTPDGSGKVVWFEVRA